MAGLERLTSGEALARQGQQREGPAVLPLEDFQVQVCLARAVFPDAAKPMNEWVAGENPWSDRFRSYREDPARTREQKFVDIKDNRALMKLFEAVKAHSLETIH